MAKLPEDTAERRPAKEQKRSLKHPHKQKLWAEYREKNRERLRAYDRECAAKNAARVPTADAPYGYTTRGKPRAIPAGKIPDEQRRAVHNAANKRWRQNNPDYYNEYASAHRQAIREHGRRAKRKNPAKILADTRKRQLRKRNAMPKWVDERAILDIYEKCRDKSRMTGIKHVVDHVVPLAGKTVCGLHVPWNLRIITNTENMAKHNKFNGNDGIAMGTVRVSLKHFSDADLEDFIRKAVQRGDILSTEGREACLQLGISIQTSSSESQPD